MSTPEQPSLPIPPEQPPKSPADSTANAAQGPSDESPVTAKTSGWRNIKAQLQRNSVAYVSLFIAITGLLYNTWRNETSEAQRNIRSASFFAIEHLADFQSLVNDIVYSSGCSNDRDIQAWGHVKALETLGGVLPNSAMNEINELGLLWAGHAGQLCPCSIDKAINQARAQLADSEQPEPMEVDRLASSVQKQCVSESRDRREQIDQQIIFPQVQKTNAALVTLVKQLD